MRKPISALDAQAVTAPATAQAAAGSHEALSQSFRGASRAASPALVYVQVEAAPRPVRQLPDEFRDSPFGEFFRIPEGIQQMPSRGSGSGFIISSDGYILTNNHVVDNATRVTVTMTDSRQYDAEVVGRDPNTDVAVLKIDEKKLPTVRLGNSDALEVGDWVLALGYPMSLGETLTAGIVSAKGRSIGIMQQNEDAQAPLEHFIQTDAAINPGNSGGPLLNLAGEVVGINSAIASPTGAYAGYGFAVPIALAKRVADDLIRYGAVHRPKLGVQIRNLAPADVEVFELPDASGALVAAEPEAGPARDAGIRMGDVIVAVDGSKLSDTGDLMERVARRQPGDEVALDLIRYGDRKRVSVKLGSFESAPVVRNAASEPETDNVGKLGFAVQESRNGLVITQVDPRGGAPANLRGARIEKVNGQEVRSAEELRKAAAAVKAGQAVSLVVSGQDGVATIVNYKLR